jgi:hypothetical protein
VLLNFLSANKVDMEALRGLDDGMIAELFPCIGVRSKFKRNLQQYLQSSKSAAVVLASATMGSSEAFQVSHAPTLGLPTYRGQPITEIV